MHELSVTEAMLDVALEHAQKAPIFRLSCKTGEGVKEWVIWLRERLAR